MNWAKNEVDGLSGSGGLGSLSDFAVDDFDLLIPSRETRIRRVFDQDDGVASKCFEESGEDRGGIGLPVHVGDDLVENNEFLAFGSAERLDEHATRT